MLNPKMFFELLKEHGIFFFAGVPDSLLKYFCAYVTDHVPKESHLICANEGAAVSVAVGYHLATNRIGVVYMQNSGLGNAVNPLMSIADREVYATPILLLIGWRGEPGIKDEPQHRKQGRVMVPMLEAMEIPYEIINREEKAAINAVHRAVKYMTQNSAPFALVCKKGVFERYELEHLKDESFPLKRENVVKLIVDCLGPKDIVVSTTGMTSRELFEYREERQQGHSADFLTVGGMGHASQIALGIALQKPDRKVFCIDGDGSVIMHMGALAINGVQKCKNFNHFVINNGAHDSVGGQPTVGYDIDIPKIAKACGYRSVFTTENKQELLEKLPEVISGNGPSLLEIKTRRGARADLGRPTTSPIENKNEFTKFVQNR